MKHQLSRACALLLTLVLICAFTPVTVLAETTTLTRTSTLDLKTLPESETTDMLDSEGWKWEPTSSGGTLTLRNCYIETDTKEVLILTGGDVTIVLEGENTLKTKSTVFSPMVSGGSNGVALNLTIKEGAEGGKLNILRTDTTKDENNPYGFACETLTLESGEVYANTDFCIISNDFNVKDGKLVIDISNATDGNGIYSNKGNVTISGGVVDIQAGQIGIYVPGIGQGGTERISITGGEVKIDAGLAGVWGKYIDINTDGELDITGSRYAALYCAKDDGEITIEKVGSLMLDGKYSILPEQTTETKTITIAGANEEELDAAISAADALNAGDYEDFSAVKRALDAAKALKNEGKTVLEQNAVNDAAQVLLDAVSALVPKQNGGGSTDSAASGSYVEPQYYPDYEEDDESAAQPDGETRYTVICRKLNVREGAGIQYERIGQLKRGQIVVGERLNNGWTRIEYQGETAYVCSDYVQEANAAFATGDMRQVLCRRLNVREGAGTQYALLGQLARGAQIEVLEETDGWCAIVWDDGTGWVCAKYLG